MSDTPAPTSAPSNGQAISLPDGWKFTDADSRYGDDYRGGEGQENPEDAPLGILSVLEGKTFKGTGLNMLFRPNSGPPPGTKFPRHVTPAPPATPNNNVLEINLFEETLCFSKGVGRVPNRGFQGQGDINLNAIMYLQTVNDVTNHHTGKPDGRPIPIHIENGMFMHVPGTNVNPQVGTTIGRCGTIPHGVAINLQGRAPSLPTTLIQGPPTIPSIATTPFETAAPNMTRNFPSLHIKDEDTARIPQNLHKFVEQGTITQEMLVDPTVILRKANETRKIVNTAIIAMSSTNGTKTTDIKTGGGVVGSAFLDGDVDATGTAKPNARPFSVDFTLWIEAVEYEVPVPAFDPARDGGHVKVTHEGIKFVLHPPRKVAEPTTITVTVVELQYTQVVMLQFGVLTWPHPTCSTLKPEEVSIRQDDDAWKGE
ncbi:hypothetical protein B0T25DRAFT_603295 [Lasiosphaeria hispida]|uniref:Uncharacterized protein n=1 Tax=Lasiosphaeria hispida TaxID=260671 RepID=A0AAJ0HLE0_9PEZI|nr:hypothetical protein B0T25DRAFT_603295 [Lasiosphaeria hispida]